MDTGKTVSKPGPMPRLTCRTWIRLVQYLLDLRLSIALNCVTVLRIFLGKYRGSKEGRVYGAGSADSQRADWNSGRHLDDGQEGIKTLQGGDSIGTPRTGRSVLAAVTPARWAAPPAPAMMTSRPRLSS